MEYRRHRWDWRWFDEKEEPIPCRLRFVQGANETNNLLSLSKKITSLWDFHQKNVTKTELLSFKKFFFCKLQINYFSVFLLQSDLIDCWRFFIKFFLVFHAYRQLVLCVLLFLHEGFFAYYITSLCIIGFKSLELVFLICCIT